jgi:hypothetical protein
MKEWIGLNSKLSITCDVWTSRFSYHFFGFTVYLIDNEWHGMYKKDYLLLKGKARLMDVMEDFDLTHRLHGVTFDNASNNANMMAH